MSYETIEFARDGYVGWLRLNRPDKLNAFSVQMWNELRAFGKEMRDDPELRALVVIGNGRAFSSGIDTTVFTDTGGDSPLEPGEADTHADPGVASILRSVIGTHAASSTSRARAPRTSSRTFRRSPRGLTCRRTILETSCG